MKEDFQDSSDGQHVQSHQYWSEMKSVSATHPEEHIFTFRSDNKKTNIENERLGGKKQPDSQRRQKKTTSSENKHQREKINQTKLITADQLIRDQSSTLVTQTPRYRPEPVAMQESQQSHLTTCFFINTHTDAQTHTHKHTQQGAATTRCVCE